MVRLGLTFRAFRMRAASMTTALPAALSTAPSEATQLSRWAPAITYSVPRAVPGMSARAAQSVKAFLQAREAKIASG